MRPKTKTALFAVIAAILFMAIAKSTGGGKQAIEFIKSAFKKA